MMAIVYLLTNKNNGRRYVGKTGRSLDIRWQGHVGSARRSDSDMLVCRAILKHGSDAFERSIVEECNSAQLGSRETYWIHELKTHVSQGGYNLTYGGDGGIPGYKHREDSLEKMRLKATGRHPTEETLEKLRAAKRGKKQKPEHVEKRAASNRGKKRAPEVGQKISAALIGHEVKPVTRAKLSVAGKKRKTTEETKQKLRVASTGKQQSEDAKQRISASRLRPVLQFSSSGNLICGFPSVKAAVQFTGSSATSISRSLSSGKVIAGFMWRYDTPTKECK
jgi:group I intron endonuclease